MPTTLSIFTLYRDPDAAVAWLEQALGFEVVNQFADDGGVQVLRAPETTAWGNHRFEVLDPGGPPVVGRELPAGADLMTPGEGPRQVPST